MIKISTNKEKLYAFLEKSLDGKNYQTPLRDSVFFAKNKKNKSSLIAGMTEWSNAFVLNGITNYGCLTCYRLQKNASNGIIKMNYAENFGPTDLFIDSRGEETNAKFNIIENFKLVSIDGQKPSDY